MAGRKQVMDIHVNSSGITQAESNDQQRNRNDKTWKMKASDSLSNYDPTRKHLNIEVAKGGTIQPIDTLKSIAQKMAESLTGRGIKDHNNHPNVRRRQLALRQKMLDDANSTLTKAKQRLAEMKYEHSRMQEVLGEDRDLQSIQLQRNMLTTFISMLVPSLEPLTPTLTDHQQEIVNESGYSDLMRNSNSIINCAMLLSLGYIHEATTCAESCGGGGSPGSGWGRDKDEDDDHWWRRCIAVSAAMMRPAKYRLRRGR